MTNTTQATIDTTIGPLVDAEPALARLVAMKLDAKLRYHAVKLSRLVASETKWHFAEPRLQAFKEFGVERDPTPAEMRLHGPDTIYDIALATPENRAAYGARIKELRDVPVSIPWGPITSTMLDPYPEFTGADMLALGPLFHLDEPAGG